MQTLEQQLRDWPNHLKGAEAGSPYATLCLACYGRHAPPRDHLCAASAIEAAKAGETPQGGSTRGESAASEAGDAQ
jgi:hypothetical protein